MSSAVAECDTLTLAQRNAINSIRQQAQGLRTEALRTISHIMNMSNVDSSTADAVRSAVRDHAHVAIHFHPDRPVGSRVVAQALLEDGVYRNQFETGISNGLVSTVLDGPRDSWEKSLFSGAYHDGPELRAAERPKYGALDLTCHPDGPAPRFGSCYLVLKPEVSRRSTFTFGGSQEDPKFRGTIDEFDAILSAILEESFTRDFALGVSDVRPASVMSLLRESLTTPRQFRTESASHNLDHMVEAQVHGDVRLGRDVEALVADGSFADGDTGRVLKAIGERFGFPVRFNGGFQLPVESIPPNFRGPDMPSLAARVAASRVDARTIGKAAQDLFDNRDEWRDRGTYEEVLQELKLLWHVLVKYGRPIAP
ncbi:hypothetical protein JDV02_008128 [Purpureocillium takamizusanense]|uniref:DUF3626 domain-containing protein n=1 Tax=Purpureocillium takamizusanense TaxID=2060973 RepID=A0A9Q8VES9_9HYPO|nr:uncharacterized protein JDV02_008128 [Purpureocillium takamizusanense]UNI22219.1 hypothetical protein JDV02_008128 [Purpureocillium takamizusanense]